jgi:UPF0755 protein
LRTGSRADSPKPRRRGLVFGIASFFAVLVLAGIGAVTYELTHGLPPAGGSADVRVVPGSSARSIARALRDAGVPLNQWEFVVAASLSHATRSLRAGRYHIEGQPTLLDLVEKFRRGDVEREQMTIVEGSTFAELRAAIAASEDLRHDTRNWTAEQILHAIGAGEEQAEGLFAPDTYTFDPDASDLEVYRPAYLAQRDRLERAWQARSADLPYKNSYEALIMASIVEKETGQTKERRQVAAVFVNRQRLGMPLQTDPTVIYGMGEQYAGRLHKRDLQSDTPYNTYTRAGLPPTPIALPGKAAIDAALEPEASKALYFVARGDGSSEFSNTLAEHNRAVDRYQRATVKHE